MKERQTRILKQHELPWHLRDHGLFVGYAPADNPKYAVAVLVEHGGGGSTAAAPIASKILLEAVKLDSGLKKFYTAPKKEPADVTAVPANME